MIEIIEFILSIILCIEISAIPLLIVWEAMKALFKALKTVEDK